jgi:Pilus formation protein N terminal region
MTPTSNLPRIAALACLSLFSGLNAAAAGEPITVFTDHSRALNVGRPPGTIIVGNPSIADVTISGTQVMLHARSYGTTSVIILDEAGAQLADYEVTVQSGGNDNVYVFRAGNSLLTYLCAPDCERTLHIGDDDKPFKIIAGQQKARTALALGQKAGENVAQNGANGEENAPAQ